MTLAETLVAALILSVSCNVALQGWQRLIDIQQQDVHIHEALRLSEQQLLAARRLLAVSPSGSHPTDDLSCEQVMRTWSERLNAGLAPAAGVQQTWSDATSVTGLRLEVSVSSMNGEPPLTRRVLLTPSGLGRCQGDQR